MRRYRARARFVKKTPASQHSPAGALSPALPRTPGHLSETAPAWMADTDHFPGLVPGHFLRPPPLQDELTTATSESQQETLAQCLPLLGAVGDPSRNPFEFNEHGVPELRKEEHVDFLQENLSQFPAPFVGLDASRPWLVYWGLMGLYFLGEDVTLRRRQ